MALPCPRCRNSIMFQLREISRWFSLFFIPIFPYSKKHYMMCPVCSFGIELEGKKLDYAEKMIEVTKKYKEKKIDFKDYDKKIERYAVLMFGKKILKKTTAKKKQVKKTAKKKTKRKTTKKKAVKKKR